ncbi:MAG: hypothetical protein ACMXX9_02760 [Candidatus Woesearchaeota archaeon]
MKNIEDLTMSYFFLDTNIKSEDNFYKPHEYKDLNIITSKGENLGKIKKIIRHKDHSQNFIVTSNNLIKLNRPKDMLDLGINYKELEEGYKFN